MFVSRKKNKIVMDTPLLYVLQSNLVSYFLMHTPLLHGSEVLKARSLYAPREEYFKESTKWYTYEEVFTGVLADDHFKRLKDEILEDEERCLSLKEALGRSYPPRFRTTPGTQPASAKDLPTELILQIAEDLPPVTGLFMQRVCNQFRQSMLLPDGTPPEIANGLTAWRLNIGQRRSETTRRNLEVVTR